MLHLKCLLLFAQVIEEFLPFEEGDAFLLERGVVILVLREGRERGLLVAC